MKMSKRKEADGAEGAEERVAAEEPEEEKKKKKQKKKSGALKHVAALVSCSQEAALAAVLETLGAKVCPDANVLLFIFFFGALFFFFLFVLCCVVFDSACLLQVLKRPAKSVTHCVFGPGGDPNFVVGCLDEGAVLVGPGWVAACEQQQCEASTAEHVLEESAALRMAEEEETLRMQKEEEEEQKQQQQQQEQEDEDKNIKKKKQAAAKTKKKKNTTAAARKRKQRSKKKSGAAAVPRDETGAVVLPLTLGALTLVSLGALEGRGPAFHCADALFPVGFVSESVRPSYKHPATKVRYVFSVELAPDGESPQFRAVCAHDTANPIVGSSTSEVCMRIATLLAEAKNEKPPSRAPRGNDWFGLSNETVRELLQQLPGAQNREGYKWLGNDDEEEQEEEEEEEEGEEEDEGKGEKEQGEREGEEQQKQAEKEEEEEAGEKQQVQQPKKKKQKKRKVKAGASAEVRAAKRAEKDAARAKRAEEAAAKQAAKAAEEEKKAEKKRQEQEKKRVEQEKKQQEQEAKKREKEEAAAKKEAGQMKLTALMGMVVKKDPEHAAPAAPAPALALPPPRRARIPPEELERMILQQQQKTAADGAVPADYLVYARQFRRKFRRSSSSSNSSHVLRTLRFWDDNFRPAFSVRAASYRMTAPLSGRRPTARVPGRDYDDESDDDWEGWDEQEESLGDDDPEEAEEQAEEDEKGFVVPDTVIELEDGEMVSDVQTLPPRSEARRRVPLVTSGPQLPSFVAVPLCKLPVSPAQRPAEWPAVTTATPGGAVIGADGVASLDVSSTPAATGDEAKKKRAAPSKKPLSVEAAACVRAALENQEAGHTKSKLVEAAAALFEQRHPSMARPSKMALERGLNAIAEYNGKAWVLRELQQATLDQTLPK